MTLPEFRNEPLTDFSQPSERSAMESAWGAALYRDLNAVSAIGWPLERLRGVAGRLARENAERNPSRTAVTAAALMVTGLMVKGGKGLRPPDSGL